MLCAARSFDNTECSSSKKGWGISLVVEWLLSQGTGFNPQNCKNKLYKLRMQSYEYMILMAFPMSLDMTGKCEDVKKRENRSDRDSNRN